MRRFRSRRDHNRNLVSMNSSTVAPAPAPAYSSSDVFPVFSFTPPTVVSSSPSFGASSSTSSSDVVPVFSFTHPSTVVSSSLSFGSSSSSSSTVVPSASENPSPGVFCFGDPCQLFSSPPQIGSFSSSPFSFLSEDSTMSATITTTTTTAGIPEKVVNGGHFPRVEEHQVQKVKDEGEGETESGPVSSQSAIPTNESAVPPFGTLNSVETLREEVKEMQKSAAEDSCISELSAEFNLLINGSRILRGIPQSPHFCSLQAYSGRARKNLISGWDQTFEETYDQIQSLKVTDFWNSKYELELTLDELESMGYNVGCLRKRLDEFTNVMEKRESALFAMWSLRTKMESHKREKQKLEGKIYKLHMQVEKEQANINGLMDEVAKLEESLPVVDTLFASQAALPL